jgi:hypothetical protein
MRMAACQFRASDAGNATDLVLFVELEEQQSVDSWLEAVGGE